MPDAHDNVVIGGPFAQSAVHLAQLGLAPIPCPSDDGKSPRGAIRGYNKWLGPPCAETIKKLICQHGSANVGIVTGASPVTVVDVDGNEEIVRRAIELFGDTPLKTSTPSGGVHLWYAKSGERDANLRSPPLSLPIDIRNRGIIVVPPSVRPSSEKPYTFQEGSWSDLKRLSVAQMGWLAGGNSRFSALCYAPQGKRNDSLFRLGLREVRYCDTLDALLDSLHTHNDNFDPPLEHAEVMKIARSVWEKQCNEENWVGQEARAVVGKSLLAELILHDGADALMLYAKLKTEHGARDSRGQPFAIAPNAMVHTRVMGRWSAERIRNARALLVRVGELECVRQGGRGLGPSLYCFRRNPSTSLDNITITPSSSRIGLVSPKSSGARPARPRNRGTDLRGTNAPPSMAATEFEAPLQNTPGTSKTLPL